MAKKTKLVNGSRPTTERYPRLEPAALGKAIEAQRQELSHTFAMVHSNAKLLHQSYRFEIGEADLAYCCEGLCMILKEVIAALEPLWRASTSKNTADRRTLAKTLEAQRQVLFRAHAIAELIGQGLAAHNLREHDDADVGIVFASIAGTLDGVLAAIEPLSLGLLTPSVDD
jgi:hypothetical protein